MVDHQLSQVGRYSQAELSTGMTGAIFFNKMGHPWPLFHLFLSFQTNITILQQINVKNVHPVYGAGIRTHQLWNISLPP